MRARHLAGASTNAFLQPFSIPPSLHFRVICNANANETLPQGAKRALYDSLCGGQGAPAPGRGRAPPQSGQFRSAAATASAAGIARREDGTAGGMAELRSGVARDRSPTLLFVSPVRSGVWGRCRPCAGGRVACTASRSLCFSSILAVLLVCSLSYRASPDISGPSSMF